MNEILLNRLRLIHGKMKTDLDNIPSTLSETTLLQGQIAQSKLGASVKRFNEDLNEYFRLVNSPSSDDISQMSVTQLEAEEALAEISVKIKTIISKVKDNTDRDMNKCASITGKLPKLNLPKFDGNVLNWHQFWDQFSSIIDSKNLSDVDKLSYLKVSVTGEAEKAIDGFETTNKNYGLALATLKERFGKSSYLIDAHYSSLYKIKPAHNNALDCRRTLNDIERNLRILESLGENINHNHLRFLIMEKFPKELIYEIKVKACTDSIQEIRNHLEKTIMAREDAERITKTKPSTETESCTVEALYVQEKQMKFRNGQLTTGDGFKRRNNAQGVANSKFQYKRRYEQEEMPNHIQKKRPRFRSCIFCNGDHYNENCDKFKTINERKTQLKNRCFGCFRVGHTILYCNNMDKKCPHCRKEGHNRALCSTNFHKAQKLKTPQ